MDGTLATNFRLLGSLFDDRMNRLAGVSAQKGTADAETELVKTYVLELTEHSLPEPKLRNALGELFTTPPSDTFRGLQVHQNTEEPLLQVTCRSRGKRISAYVDFRDSRFLRLYSTTQSDLIDSLVRGWTARLSALDHAWFDDTFLDKCSMLGEFKGLGIEFSNAILTSVGDDAQSLDERGDSIRLRQSGRASAMLSLLRESDAFSEQSSLAMVRVKYPHRSKEQQVTAEIRYDGRISGRGASFKRLTEIGDKVVNAYRSKVLDVERRHSMSGRHAAGGYAITGRPVIVNLRPTIVDLSLFCSRIFGAVNPFRLAGIPQQVAKDHYVVRAVDLHTSQTLRFEVKPDRIWVYLPAGTCGNTLLRFVTNLQRHHSRLTKAEALGGGTADAL